MAQPTGTMILAKARLLAQDTNTTNPAVSDANALILLNDVLLRYTGDTRQKVSVLAASATGLTFAANDTNKTTTVDVAEIVSAHQSATSAANALASRKLDLWTVEQMLAAYDDAGSGTQTGSATQWQAYAWEHVYDTAGDGETSAADYVRVYVWPPLNTTGYLTLRAKRYMTLSALTGYPDISERDAANVARLLAWEMARLHTRDAEFLNQILAPLPDEVLKSYYETAMKSGMQASMVVETGSLDG